MDFTPWREQFEAADERRRSTPEPLWANGSAWPTAVVRSVQRFQTGEDGDGRSLIAKSAAAGDPQYLAAVRLFVAEEQGHARSLAGALAAAGAPTVSGHWSDTAFVAVRRALGLRLELMTLMTAEVVALRYYRALRDAAPCPVLRDVAGRLLCDEERHVPFHVARLREGLGHLPRPVRALVAAGWWTLMAGATAVVAVDHGAALRALDLSSGRFALDVVRLFRPIVAQVLGRATPESVVGEGPVGSVSAAAP
jgi:hypothetical protein